MISILTKDSRSGGATVDTISGHGHVTGNRKTHGRADIEVQGGDFAEKLSDKEIEAVAAETVNLALPCRLLFDWAAGTTSNDAIRTAFLGVAMGAVFILWVRHHWVAARRTGEKSWEVYDSAPGDAVHRTLKQVGRIVGWNAPTLPSVPRQYAGSNECGIFALVYAYLAQQGAAPLCSNARISLAHCRALLLANKFRAGIEVARTAVTDVSAPTAATHNTYRHDPYDSRRSRVQVGQGERTAKRALIGTCRCDTRCEGACQRASVTMTCAITEGNAGQSVVGGTSRNTRPGVRAMVLPPLTDATAKEKTAGRRPMNPEAKPWTPIGRAQGAIEPHSNTVPNPATPGDITSHATVTVPGQEPIVVPAHLLTEATVDEKASALQKDATLGLTDPSERILVAAAQEVSFADLTTPQQWQDGRMISSRVLWDAQRHIEPRLGDGVVLLLPDQFVSVVVRRRRKPASMRGKDIICIVHHNAHYVCFAFRRNSIVIYDSVRTHCTPERQRLASMFAAYCAEANQTAEPECHLVPGPQQPIGSNDCLVFALNNAMLELSGQRGAITRVGLRQHYVGGQPFPVDLLFGNTQRSQTTSMASAQGTSTGQQTRGREKRDPDLTEATKSPHRPAARAILVPSVRKSPQPPPKPATRPPPKQQHKTTTDASLDTPHAPATATSNLLEEKPGTQHGDSSVSKSLTTRWDIDGELEANNATELAAQRKILATLAPLTAVEVDWRYAHGTQLCTWVGKIFESSGRKERRQWPVQYTFVDSRDGLRTCVESALPVPPAYEGHPVVILAIRPLKSEGPLRQVVLPPQPQLPKKGDTPGPLCIGDTWDDNPVPTPTLNTQLPKHPTQKARKQWWLSSQATVAQLMRKAEGRANKWLSVSVMPEPALRVADQEDMLISVVGKVIRDAGDLLLQVEISRCRACGAWKKGMTGGDSEGPLIPMPVPHCSYFAASIVGTLPTVDCECDEDNDDDEPTHGIDTPEFTKELAPDASLGWCTNDTLRGETCARWYIFSDKPAHVHTLTWKQLQGTTRRTHIRWLSMLKQMPSTYHQAPLGAAAIQVVLTEAQAKKWTSWATVSSALSSVASALRHLPEYTANRGTIDIMADPQFASAAKRAQHLARITKRHKDDEALTATQYSTLVASCKDPTLRTFLQICWALAGRVGDVRQLCGRDITFGEKTPSGKQSLQATFRSGKGAAFWGPYTVATTVEPDAAKALAEIIRSRGKMAHLFTTAEQQALSRMVRDAGVTDVRSIRRGRLQHLAECGATSEQLRLLSGHKRVDTLMRYLGWGLFSADGRKAAIERDAMDKITGAGCDLPTPRKMGKYAGHCGHKGQRISRPPQLFRPPKSKDLGIVPENTHDWPLKANATDTLSWGKVASIIHMNKELTSKDDRLTMQRKLAVCEKWCSDRPMAEQGYATKTMAEEDIPVTKIKRRDYDTLLGVRKIVPLGADETIRGWASGYLIPQAKKKQRRPVWEPDLNKWSLEEQPTASYPSRRARRYLRRHTFTTDFDFRNFFDQFELTKSAQAYYVCRYAIEEHDGSITSQSAKLTRLPMGVTFAPAVAQALTDALTLPLRNLPNVRIYTMIDNVRIAGRTAAALAEAVQIFLTRCEAAGVAINPPEDMNGNPIERNYKSMSVADFATWGLTPKIFLGEVIDTGKERIRNAPKNTDKLITAWGRIVDAALPSTAPERTQQRRDKKVTFRHLVSVISLALFLLHTHDVHLCHCNDLLSTYSKLSARAAITGFDTPMEYLGTPLKTMMDSYVARIVTLDTNWSPLPVEPLAPSTNDMDYDVVVNSDSCGSGWAAFIRLPKTGKMFLLRQRWRTHTKTRFDLSTVSEPVALFRALQWVKTQSWYTATTKIAAVTDHSPIVSGQQRWWSGNGGFSANPFLNSCFTAMHDLGVTAFFIEGTLNPADAPSRSSTLGPIGPISATEIRGHTWTAPPLAELEFPFGLTDDEDDDSDDGRFTRTREKPRLTG